MNDLLELVDGPSAAEVIGQAARSGARPDPQLSVSEWADRYRVLTSRSSPEPGPWSTMRTPFLQAIMDDLSPRSRAEIVVFMKGSQIGGPLALDTPIPTTEGWTTMGEVQVGDRAFDENGHPCWVTSVSPIFCDRPCYRIVLSDGGEFIADSEHRWIVWDDPGGEGKRRLRKMTTGEMYPRHKAKKRNRYAIDVAGPMTLPEAALPIDPYLLGVWLGNGHHYMNQITIHEDDRDFEALLAGCGFEAQLRYPSWRKGKTANILIDPGRHPERDEANRFTTAVAERPTFVHTLETLGVLRNKHIPAIYLRASMSQRLALLQGLMDTDGHCSKLGRSEYSTVSPRMRDEVYELLASLGLKPTIYHSDRPCGKRTYPKSHFRLSFLAYSDLPVFRLPRKLARQKAKDPNRTRPTETHRRRIVNIEPVASVPVRCISVDSASHLYLAGRNMTPTHNTECGNNWIGFNIHHAPGPMMAVQPTTEMAKRNSKQRIAPLIEDSPVLRELVKDPRSRDSGNTVLAKEFPGGILVMVGANSAAGLRSMSARYLFLDEVDGYPGDVEGEGEPCDLAIARTTNYARRKIFITSTPVVSGRSRIERFFEQSDQRYYYVPCPFCALMQTLRFEQLRWPKHNMEAASYHCDGCGRSIPNHAKNFMLPRGEWKAHAVNDGKMHGYHLSSLYSPVGWLSWGQIAAKHEAAQKDREKQQVFHNTILGIPWADTGEVPDTDRLFERREHYQIGTVPRGGLLLTAGGDVQRTRVEVEVVAWGRNKQSWSVDYRVFEGDTTQPAVWEHVAAMLDEEFPTEYQTPMRIQRLAVDSGFNTTAVYDFVRRMSPQRVMAVKGDSRVSALVGAPNMVEVGPAGRRMRYGIRLWPINSSIAKEELYRWLRTAVPDLAKGEAWPTGFCHFPEYSKEYFEQLTAEQLVTRTHGGLRRSVWEKRRERNEALDCRIYARAAAGALRFETWSSAKWDELEAALLSKAPAATASAVKPAAGTATPVPAFRPAARANESWLE